jgi:hypothetical protein
MVIVFFVWNDGHLRPKPARNYVGVNTSDRLPRSQRKRGHGSLFTARAGTLLKQQIPIRTFQDWEETHPGFLEADLVAHCGTQIEGGYLYTLTLTDVATGWTECLPLMHRSREAVLVAHKPRTHAFPFSHAGNRYR